MSRFVSKEGIKNNSYSFFSALRIWPTKQVFQNLSNPWTSGFFARSLIQKKKPIITPLRVLKIGEQKSLLRKWGRLLLMITDTDVGRMQGLDCKRRPNERSIKTSYPSDENKCKSTAYQEFMPHQLFRWIAFLETSKAQGSKRAAPCFNPSWDSIPPCFTCFAFEEQKLKASDAESFKQKPH